MSESVPLSEQEKKSYGCGFFEENKRLIFSICMKYVKEPHTAEDLTQDAFIRFYQNIDAIRGSAVAFLKTIAVNLCIDFLRRKSSHREDTLDEGVEPQDAAQGRSGLIEPILKLESGELIREALAELDEYCKSYIFYTSQGFKLNELSEMLKTPPSKIRSDSARCPRKAMRELCIKAGMSEFSQQERVFIKNYFENIYNSKGRVIELMGLPGEADFIRIYRSILNKLGEFYSSS